MVYCVLIFAKYRFDISKIFSDLSELHWIFILKKVLKNYISDEHDLRWSQSAIKLGMEFFQSSHCSGLSWALVSDGERFLFNHLFLDGFPPLIEPPLSQPMSYFSLLLPFQFSPASLWECGVNPPQFMTLFSWWLFAGDCYEESLKGSAWTSMYLFLNLAMWDLIATLCFKVIAAHYKYFSWLQVYRV